MQCGPTTASGWDIEAGLYDIVFSGDEELATGLKKADSLANFFIQYRRILWLDDFHLLHQTAFDFLLLKIWNASRLPMIFTGNPQGITKKLHKFPAQLRSRVQHVPIVVGNAFKAELVAALEISYQEAWRAEHRNWPMLQYCGAWD